MERGRWHSPISGLSTLAFVADRASFALSKDSVDSPGDRAALLEAAELLEAALQGERQLRKCEFGAAAAHQFNSLAWTARALSSLAAVPRVQASPDIQEILHALSDTLNKLGRGEEVGDEEWVEVARRFFDEVDRPSVGLTLDTGHFWSALCEDEFGYHKEDPIMRTPEGNRLLNRMCCEMARAVGERLVNIHIHNLRPGDWLDHQPVDSGVMRYREFFQILRDIGYGRTVIVEIRPTEGWVGFESSAAFLQRFR